MSRDWCARSGNCRTGGGASTWFLTEDGQRAVDLVEQRAPVALRWLLGVYTKRIIREWRRGEDLRGEFKRVERDDTTYLKELLRQKFLPGATRKPKLKKEDKGVSLAPHIASRG